MCIVQRKERRETLPSRGIILAGTDSSGMEKSLNGVIETEM